MSNDDVTDARSLDRGTGEAMDRERLSRTVAHALRHEGLRPTGRQHVHLSADRPTAREVGRRTSGDPVILVVRAGEAHRAGIPFYRGNERVWLVGSVPPEHPGPAE